jgi:hypothetical protein
MKSWLWGAIGGSSASISVISSIGIFQRRVAGLTEGRKCLR